MLDTFVILHRRSTERGPGHERPRPGVGLALGPGHIPPRSGDELKIVWRMTGTGPLHVSVTAPNGRRQPLVFGPEAHAVSNYHRPGDEWGTGFRFSGPGCWHVKLTRNSTSGDVWLNVRT